MTSEFGAALIGAILGAILTGVISYFQFRWSSAAQSRAERDQQRLLLVREIMRHRLKEELLIGPLNEIPLVFGEDHDALRLYREMLNAQGSDGRTRALTDLISRLAQLVELPSNVQHSDIQRGFQVES